MDDDQKFSKTFLLVIIIRSRTTNSFDIGDYGCQLNSKVIKCFDRWFKGTFLTKAMKSMTMAWVTSAQSALQKISTWLIHLLLCRSGASSIGTCWGGSWGMLSGLAISLWKLLKCGISWFLAFALYLAGRVSLLSVCSASETIQPQLISPLERYLDCFLFWHRIHLPRSTGLGVAQGAVRRTSSRKKATGFTVLQFLP